MGQENSDDVDMNMEPLIDVTFQLLIFFMLSINFPTQEGVIKSHMPTDQGLQSSKSQSPDEFRLQLRYKSDTSTTVLKIKGDQEPIQTWKDGEEITGENRRTLGEESKNVWETVLSQNAGEKTPVKIDPGPDVPSGRVVIALDILNEYIIQRFPQKAEIQWAGDLHASVEGRR